MNMGSKPVAPNFPIPDEMMSVLHVKKLQAYRHYARILREELPGHDQYREQVKYRLIPGIW